MKRILGYTTALFVINVFIANAICTNEVATQKAVEHRVDSLKSLFSTANDTTRLSIYFDICNLFFETNYDSVNKYNNLMIKLSEETKIYPYTFAALVNRGTLYAHKGMIDSAYFWYLESLKISKEKKYLRGEVSALACLSSMYDELGDIENFLKYAKKSLNIGKREKDTIAIIYSSVNVGLAYIGIQQYDSAGAVLDYAFALSKNYNNYKYHSLLTGLGLLYEEQKKWTDALYYYQLALQNSGDNPVSEGIDHHNIGGVMLKLNEPDSAISHFFMALEKFNNINHNLYLSHVYNGLGNAMLKKENRNLAIEYFNKGLSTSKKVDAPQQILAALDNLQSIYDEMDNTEKALMYLKAYNALKDSIALEEQKSNIRKEQFLENCTNRAK